MKTSILLGFILHTPLDMSLRPLFQSTTALHFAVHIFSQKFSGIAILGCRSILRFFTSVLTFVNILALHDLLTALPALFQRIRESTPNFLPAEFE
jgi:hypothetical protein